MIRPTYIGSATALASLLAACAVGPNFKTPQAPQTPGFVAPGELPKQTTTAPAPDDQAQRFVEGLDIQGQWWTLFQSADLTALLERGLANSPTLEAATAALRQAKETLAAQRGSFFPSISGALSTQRQKASGLALRAPQP